MSNSKTINSIPELESSREFELARTKRLYVSLCLIGMSANLIVLAISFATFRDPVLNWCTITLIVTSIVSVLVSSRHLLLALHIFLFSYWCVFTYACFTDLNRLSLILVYPIIVGLAFLLFERDRNRGIYVILCAVGLVINVCLQHVTQDNDNPYFLAASLVISLAMFLAFSYLSFVQIRLIEDSRQKILQKEQALLQKNEELTKHIESNIQLEQFAHIAAHDLRSPVRTMAGFVALLKRDFGRGKHENADEYLSTVQDLTQTMSNLIEDLLAYSKANANKLTISEFDLAILIEEVVKNLLPITEDTEGWITTKNISGVVSGDRVKLRQVLQNLISNALKFTASGEHPQIVITRSEDEQFHYVVVADRGIGIEDAYKEKVFNSYTRLNPSEYEGTGMGLSISQKIVERHGGAVVISNNSPTGSIFTFSVAKDLG